MVKSIDHFDEMDNKTIVRFCILYFLSQMNLLNFNLPEPERERYSSISMYMVGGITLFDEMALEELGDLFQDAVIEAEMAAELERIDEVSKICAEALAARGFSHLAALVIFAYMTRFQQFDDVRVSILNDICRVGGIDGAELIKTARPVLDQWYADIEI